MSQLGWPIQSYPHHQTRDVRIGRHERNEITMPVEWRSLEKVLHLIKFARGLLIIISFKHQSSRYHLHFHCYHLRCRLQSPISIQQKFQYPQTIQLQSFNIHTFGYILLSLSSSFQILQILLNSLLSTKKSATSTSRTP